MVDAWSAAYLLMMFQQYPRSAVRVGGRRRSVDPGGPL
jgi:hypothetical protein